jgi:hypothetical protein
VFNRIAWYPGAERDLWVMQQSHDGRDVPFHSWDRLAIEVDRTRSVARFVQVEPGPIERAAISAAPRPRRAECSMCHLNGPRVIRPLDALSAWDRGRLALWNLRIKTYGRVRSSEPVSAENTPLPLKTCAKCHNDSAWGRGQLTRQNEVTIRFMVREGYMPPWGFRMEESEKRELGLFLRGFLTSRRTANR